jgi:hypothetical protein
MRLPGISGEKIMRRSVEVSVPPPRDSYRVVAGKRVTVFLGGNSIIEERTISWWIRVLTFSKACTAAGGSGSVSRKLPPTIQKTSIAPR